MGGIVVVTLVLGATNVAKAATSALGWETPEESLLLRGSAVLVLLLAWPVGRRLASGRRPPASSGRR
jgi:hypothetical protein